MDYPLYWMGMIIWIIKTLIPYVKSTSQKIDQTRPWWTHTHIKTVSPVASPSSLASPSNSITSWRGNGSIPGCGWNSSPMGWCGATTDVVDPLEKIFMSRGANKLSKSGNILGESHFFVIKQVILSTTFRKLFDRIVSVGPTFQISVYSVVQHGLPGSSKQLR